MLYYSFVYGRLTYGITVWGTAAQKPTSRNWSQIKQYHAYHDLGQEIFSCKSTLKETR